jgi:HSP20 family protein
MAQEQEQKVDPEAKGVEVAKPESEIVKPEQKQRGSMTTAERTSPFGALGRFMADMDRLFGFGVPSLSQFKQEAWIPAIETFERDGNLVLRTELPGLRREDVQVEVLGDELVISGERKQEEDETRGGRRYSERRYGSFERRLTLPANIDPASIDASFENGVLEVSVKVPEERGGRKIEVRSGSKKSEPGPSSVH